MVALRAVGEIVRRVAKIDRVCGVDVDQLSDDQADRLKLALLRRAGRRMAEGDPGGPPPGAARHRRAPRWEVLIVDQDLDNPCAASISPSGFRTKQLSLARTWANHFNRREARENQGLWAVIRRAPKMHQPDPKTVH